jgi:hypothetical protein
MRTVTEMECLKSYDPATGEVVAEVPVTPVDEGFHKSKDGHRQFTQARVVTRSM